MKRTIVCLLLASLLIGCEADPIDQLTDKVFELAKNNYTAIDATLDEGRFPRSINDDGTLRTSDVGWWCSGFYPGSLWLIYEYTGDESMKQMAWSRTKTLLPLLGRNTDHDIGFQINCSFGNAMRITGDTASMKEYYVAAARKLADRFNPAAGVIRSWDFLRNDWRYPVIIDNMMNLELLTVASRLSGDESFAEVANAHAKTTLRNHFRDDFTSWHLIDYDPLTGDVRYRETVQGYAHSSAWARGQAWALYGYSMMYRETADGEYLTAAQRIADVIISLLPEDGIPWWDFHAPGTPHSSESAAEPLRDASAGAIMASAFVELSTLTANKELSEKYLDVARTQIFSLGSPEYLAEGNEAGGFLLKHCVGNLPDRSEIDVPLSYADYYFLEAIMRYKAL